MKDSEGLRVFAPAKVNLALHVTGVRADGYHLLESLVVFADVGDTITAGPDAELSLSVSGPFAAGVPVDDTNLVLKAAQKLRKMRGVTTGARLHLDKHLPHGAGIGGGSSDAAATIRALAQMWDVPPLSAAEALPLGADVPVCLRAPAPTLMRGIGDVLDPAPHVPEAWLVLVNPGVSVPTGKVFGLHDTLYDFSPLGLEPLTPADAEAFDNWLSGQRNDLTKVARENEIAPVVGTVLDALWAHCDYCCEMSGSGSTCWAWFPAEAEAKTCAEALKADHPDWWIAATRITGS